MPHASPYPWVLSDAAFEAEQKRPEPEVFCRPVGGIQWLCPDCTYIHNSRNFPWRRGYRRCQGCHHRYRFGVHVSKSLTAAAPPFNAHFCGPWNGYTVNRLFGAPPGDPAIGRLFGRVEGRCPTCKQRLHGTTDFATGRIACACGATFYLSLLIWRSTNAARTVPLDFIPPTDAPDPSADDSESD